LKAKRELRKTAYTEVKIANAMPITSLFGHLPYFEYFSNGESVSLSFKVSL